MPPRRPGPARQAQTAENPAGSRSEAGGRTVRDYDSGHRGADERTGTGTWRRPRSLRRPRRCSPRREGSASVGCDAIGRGTAGRPYSGTRTGWCRAVAGTSSGWSASLYRLRSTPEGSTCSAAWQPRTCPGCAPRRWDGPHWWPGSFASSTTNPIQAQPTPIGNPYTRPPTRLAVATRTRRGTPTGPQRSYQPAKWSCGAHQKGHRWRPAHLTYGRVAESGVTEPGQVRTQVMHASSTAAGQQANGVEP